MLTRVTSNEQYSTPVPIPHLGTDDEFVLFVRNEEVLSQFIVNRSYREFWIDANQRDVYKGIKFRSCECLL